VGFVVFLLLVLLGWAVLRLERVRIREKEGQERAARRHRDFARVLSAIEWNGAFRTQQVQAAPGSEPRQPAEEFVRPARPEAASSALPPPPETPRIARPAPAAASIAEAPRAAAVASSPSPAHPSRTAPAAAPPPRGSKDELRAAVQRYSAWREHVRSFLIENIGWFIGGFLVVAGSLYFLREAWGSFAQLGRQMLIVATSLAYAAGFVGVALWLKRKHGLATASRAMAYVGLALVPVAALAASGTFELRVWAWAVAGPAVLAVSYPVLYLAAGLLDRPLAAPLARALLALLALVILGPAVAALSPAAVLLLPYAGWAVLHFASAVPLRGSQAPSAAVLAFHLSALAYALLFVLGLSHSLGGAVLPFPAFYGPLTVLASFTALRVDVELRARWGSRPEIDTAVVASFAAALAGVALAAGHPAYLALSAALAAAHFAAGIAWYRRPLLVYFSLGAGAASVVFLLVSSRLARAAVDAACALSGSGPATWGETFCMAALGILGCSALAAWLDRRFHQRGEPRLGSAASRSATLLLLLAATGSLSAAASGSRLGPALVLAFSATLLATWHRRAPRQWTAWTGAAAFSFALALALLRTSLAPGTALAIAGVALMLASFPFLRRDGDRLGASALVHWALLAAGAALATDLSSDGIAWDPGLAVFTLLWGAGAVVLGNGIVGLLASGGGLCLLALSLFGPTAFRSWPSSDVRWAVLPAVALAASFASTRLSRAWKGPRPLPTPLRSSRPGLLALAEPLLDWGAVTTALLALRGGLSIDAQGALLLGAAALCAIALAPLSRDARWSATAAGFAIVAGAWEATSLLGPRVPASALGGALAASAVLALARSLRTRAAAYAEAVIDLCALALALVAAVTVGSVAFALRSALPANDLRLSCAALGVCAAALIALAAPVRKSAGYPALVALAAWAFSVPLALGWSSVLSGAALATLALLLFWAGQALSGGPPWAAPLLFLGPDLVAGGALIWNLVSPGRFLDWSRAICDGLLAAYLASALAAEGGVVFLHLLLALAALGAVRARGLLGIPSTGWGSVLAGAVLIGLSLALRRREKYARALLLWSALALASTCARALGAPFVRADRWNRMAAAALVAVPLAARFFPAATSGAAVAALTAALLGKVAALLPALWTSATWPLAPAALALLFALAAEPLDRLPPSLFCAPAPLVRSLRTAAVVLASVPGGFAAYAVLSAALRFPGISPAGPGLVAVVPLAFGGAALALVLRKLPGAPRPAWALSIAASLALCAALLPAASAQLPAGGALVLLAEAAVAAVIGRKDFELRWLATALWSTALAATHLQPGEWTTFAALLAGAWFVREVQLPLDLSAPTAVTLTAAGFALAWGATLSPFLARAGVSAPLGFLAAAAMFFHERRGSRPNASVLAAASTILLCIGGLGGPAEARAAFLLAGAALLVLFCAGRARSDSRWIYLAALPAIAAYAWSRSALGILSDWAAADATFALGAAFVLALLQAAMRGSTAAAPLAHLSAALPVALFFVAPPGAAPSCAAAAAALYGLLAWLRRSRAAAYAAVALVNVALFTSFRERGLTDVQLYTVPLGLSLVAAAQISHGDLSRRNLSWLRGFGCLVLYAGTAMQMLRFEGPTYPLILGGLALATVIAGVALQIRAFALLGAATLFADVLANLVRASAQSSRVMAISATATGFLILGAMIWLSLKREETLALYRRLVRAMDDWE
jgi:hypothetical protein